MSGIYSYGICRSLFRAGAARTTIPGYFKRSFAVHWTVTALILPGLISCGKDSAVLQATASIQAPVLNEGARENSNEESSILPGVPGPEEVLNRAAKSPSEMIAVLSLLEPAIASFTEKAQLYPYLKILPDMTALADRYQLDSLGASPVVAIAASLTRAAVKWIKLDEDSPQIISIFLRYAEDASRYSVAAQQRQYVHFIRDAEGLKLWAVRVHECLEILGELNPAVFVLEEFQRLQAVIVHFFFNLKSVVSQSDSIDMINAIDSEAAFQELAVYLSKEANSADSAEKVSRVIELTIALIGRANLIEAGRGQSGGVPASFQISSARIIVDAVTRIASNGLVVSDSLAESIPRVLNIQQLNLLAERLAYLRTDLLRDYQGSFFYRMTRETRKKCLEFGMLQQAASLDQALGRLALRVNFNHPKHEGTYAVRFGREHARVTVIDSGNSDILVGISIGADDRNPLEFRGMAPGIGILSFSFFNVEYNVEEGRFEGAYRHAEGSIYNLQNNYNMLVHFEFVDPSEDSPEPRIRGRVMYSIGGKTDFEGPRVETYDSLSEDAELVMESEGRYACIESVARVRALESCELNMVQLGSKVSAVFGLRNQAAGVPLPIGFYSTSKRTLYLNSGELESGLFGHLRGRFVEGGDFFEGMYIVGGIGRMYRFRAKKSGVHNQRGL